MNKVYLTVDVECHDINKKNFYIDGKIGNQYWGLKKILEIGKEMNIPINFFFDVVECREYGDQYAKDIINLIHLYGQKIYLHIHPDFVVKGGSHYFWQYSKEEQEDILRKSIEDFERLVGCESKALRIGGYCSDEKFYEALENVTSGKMIDVTHCWDYRNCKYISPTYNQMHYHGKVPVLPNTRFLCLKLPGVKKFANLDIMSANFNEMKRIMKHKELTHMVCTMHSWNLFKHLFFIPQTMAPDRYNCRKMRKYIACAKSLGWQFGDFDEPLIPGMNDSEIDLCNGVQGKLQGIANTFLRMQRAARLSKKYFFAYFIFYFLLIALIAVLLVFLL